MYQVAFKAAEDRFRSKGVVVVMFKAVTNYGWTWWVGGYCDAYGLA
jgi:hypothetical protein